MKKTFALIIAFVVILTCFAGCKKGSFEGGVVATNWKGENMAVVTKENGGIVRNEAGNVIILPTDENGYNIKDDKGEIVTQAVAIEHAIVINNRIEMADFAIEIPKGWADQKSWKDLIITKEGSTDIITITPDRTGKKADIEAADSKIIDAVKLAGGTMENKTIKVAGVDASFVAGFAKTSSADVYVAFVVFSYNGVVYNCRIDANHDLTASIDEYIAILDTIEFVH